MEYKITGIQGPEELKERLKELGLFVGQSLQTLRPLPFKGPQVVQTSQGLLSLRFDEFECLTLEQVK